MKIKKCNTYKQYEKTENKDEYLRVIFQSYEYDKEILGYILNYIEQMKKYDIAKIGYPSLTNKRVNREVQLMANDLENILKGNGIC